MCVCVCCQYHNLRPYIPVHKIPKFNPAALPFWGLYADETTPSGESNLSFNPAVKVKLNREFIHLMTSNYAPFTPPPPPPLSLSSQARLFYSAIPFIWDFPLSLPRCWVGGNRLAAPWRATSRRA